MSQACNAIGLDAQSQFLKIRQDPVMQTGSKIRVITELFGNRETLFLERKFFHRWLNSIKSARVKEGEVQAKLIKYQFESIEVIDNYFSKGSAINENFLKAAPQEFVNNLAETIASKLGINPEVKRDEIDIQQRKLQFARERLSVLKETEDLLGRFDNETRSLIQQQAIADLGYNVHPVTPSPRWKPHIYVWGVTGSQRAYFH